jgi:integrase
MATYSDRKYSDGTVGAILAEVRLRPFAPESRAFPLDEHGSYKAAKKAAKDWAKEREEKLKAERKKGRARPDVTRRTLGSLIEKYLADTRLTKNLKTIDGITKILEWWTDTYGSKKILDIDPLFWDEARAALMLKKKDCAPATINRYLAKMRKAWKWGLKKTYITTRDNLWPEELLLTEPKGIERYLSDKELASLKTELSKQDAWMRAAVLVSLACGCRQGELLQLDWADINFEEQYLAIRHIIKNDEPRLTHVSKPALEALEAIKPADVAGDTPVFVTGEGNRMPNWYLLHRWKKVLKNAGIKAFRWHDLRHTAASFLLQSGASLPEIGSVLGHQSLVSTKRYAHFIGGKAVVGADKVAAKLS